MTTNFTLYKSLIFETVRNETHISAHVQRAMDKNASELAYHEEAGDEQFHVRKLERALYASVDKIKAEIIGYLDTNSSSANINTTYNDDSINFTVVLSDRFNAAYLTPLADLVSKFIEDNMLFLWWTPINANTAKNYAEHTEMDRQQVLKCFIKNAPSKSSHTYGEIVGNSDGSSSGTSSAYTSTIVVDRGTIAINVGDSVICTYSIDSNAIDDINVSSSDKNRVTVEKAGNGKIRITGISAAANVVITLASASNLSVNKTIYVTCTQKITTVKYEFEIWADQACTKRPEAGNKYDNLYLQINKDLPSGFYFDRSESGNEIRLLIAYRNEDEFDVDQLLIIYKNRSDWQYMEEYSSTNIAKGTVIKLPVDGGANILWYNVFSFGNIVS